MTPKRAELFFLALALPEEVVATFCKDMAAVNPRLANLARENPWTLEAIRTGQIPLFDPPDDPPDNLPSNVVELFASGRVKS